LALASLAGGGRSVGLDPHGLLRQGLLFIYLINITIFEKKVIEHKMCFLIFSTNFIWNISHSKMN
jgi:hypothetical protein